MTFAGLVVAAGGRIAGNLRRFARDIVCVAGTVILPLPEAVAAGLVCHLRIAASHMDVVLTAAVVLIVRTVYNGTV